MSDAKLTLSRRKKVCFASVIFLVIWGAAEAFLLLVGAGENAFSDDPFVGFDSNNPVFIENTSGDSGWLETSPAKDGVVQSATVSAKEASEYKEGILSRRFNYFWTTFRRSDVFFRLVKGDASAYRRRRAVGNY